MRDTNQVGRNRWLVVGLVVILFGTGFTFKTWRGQLAHGNREMEKGQYEAALAAYQEGLVSAPDEPSIHYNLGNAFYEKGDFVQAGEHFKKALDLGKNTEFQLQAEYNLGNTLVQQGAALEKDQPEEALQQYESALKRYENVIRTDQKDLDAKYNYELVRKKVNELKEKLKDQNQDEKEQQDQEQQDEDQQDKNQQDKDQQDSDQQANDPQGQDQPSKDQQDQGQQGNQDKDQQSKQDESQTNADQTSNQDQQGQGAQSNPQNAQSSGDQQMAAREAAQGMTKEQALQLLEQFEGQGGQLIPVMPNKEESSGSRRDW